MSRKLSCALLLVATAACGGDGTGIGSGGLSASERAALAAAMIERAATATSPPVSRDPSGGSQADDAEYSFTFSATDVCDPSGSVALAGSADVRYVAATQSGTLDASLTITHSACAHPLRNGQPIIVTGDPNLVVDLEGSSTGGRVTSVTARQVGAFTWSRGGASGRCEVDLTGERGPAGLVQFSGTFCGFPVGGG